jgi:hypothetical protein
MTGKELLEKLKSLTEEQLLYEVSPTDYEIDCFNIEIDDEYKIIWIN